MAITLRLVKGTPLTYPEMDGNFLDLVARVDANDDEIDALEGEVDALQLQVADLDATQIDFDNTATGLPAADVQDAIDELYGVATGLVPFVAVGDILVGGTLGVPERLAIGTDGQTLKVVAGTPDWVDDVASEATVLETARNFSITGDVDAAPVSFNGSADVVLNAILDTVNGTPGSYGDAATLPVLTVNGKGLVTASSQLAIAIAASQVASGTFNNSRVAQSNVTQHQAALTILESQISDGTLLARLAADETVAGNWSFTNPVVGPTPSSANHLANKAYVDLFAQGVRTKGSCRAMATADVDISSPGGTHDTVTMAVNDRLLLVFQADQSENGIYIWGGAAVPLVRADDFDDATSVVPGSTIFVSEGALYNDTTWSLVTDAPIVVDTTNLVFTQTQTLSDLVAGDGLTKSGATVNVVTANAARIVVNADNIDLATTAVTPGIHTKVTVDAYGRVTLGASLIAADIPVLDFSKITTGIVPVTQGGSGQSSYTDGQLLIGNSTGNTLAKATLTGTANRLLVTNGGGSITLNVDATDAATANKVVARNGSGDFSANQINAVTFNTTSTKRVKKNIKKLTSKYIDAVMLLQPREYDRRDIDKHEFGFVAEEVQTVYPEIVGIDDKGRATGVDYSKVTVVLTAKVQAQQIEIDELKTHVRTLLGKSKGRK